MSKRSDQVAEIRKLITMVRGRGCRIHTYSVPELKIEVARLLNDSYFSVIPSRKLLESFL